MLEHWASRQALFNLEMAFHLPELRIEDVTATRTESAGDSATYDVTVSYRNAGRLPTALQQAQLVKIVREDRVELEFDGELTRGDEPSVEIVEPEGRGGGIDNGWIAPGETKTATFRVRTRDITGARGTVRLSSTRGGVASREFTIGQPANEGESETR